MGSEITKLLKTRFNDDKYKKIKLILNFKYQEYLKNYKFLNLETTTIQKWFYLAIKQNINEEDFINKVEATLYEYFNNYLNSLIANLDTVFLNNILIEINTLINNSSTKLKLFYNKLDELNITLTEEYFNKLKRTSKEFNKIINTLKITSFTNEDIKLLNTGKYDLYLKIKIEGQTFKWTITTFDYINSFLNPQYDLNYRNFNQLKKIKLLLENYDTITKIITILLEYYPDKNYLNQIIFNCNYNQILKLLEAYSANSLNALAIFQNLIEVNVEEKSKSIYDEFPIKTDTSTRKIIVDHLLSELSPTEKELLFNYLKNKWKCPTAETKKGRVIFDHLRFRYYRQKFTLNYDNHTINENGYKYFFKNNNDHIKKFIIDVLWEYLEPYEQNILNSYFTKEFSSSKFYNLKVINIIQKIDALYQKILTDQIFPYYLEKIIFNLNTSINIIIKCWYNLGLEKRNLLRQMLILKEQQALNSGLSKKEFYLNMIDKAKNISIPSNFNLEKIITYIITNEDISLTI